MTEHNLEVEEVQLSDRLSHHVETRSDTFFASLLVTSLALTLKIERPKLSRIFNVEKIKPLDYFLLQEKICRYAFRLMLDSKISAKEHPRHIIFGTNNYYIHAFKKYFGIVPREYIERKTKQSGIADRRVGAPDCRVDANGDIPKYGDRRKEPKDCSMRSALPRKVLQKCAILHLHWVFQKKKKIWDFSIDKV